MYDESQTCDGIITNITAMTTRVDSFKSKATNTNEIIISIGFRFNLNGI